MDGMDVWMDGRLHGWWMGAGDVRLTYQMMEAALW